jgi:ribosomal protein S18 acetylase RimI-like enzyme
VIGRVRLRCAQPDDESFLRALYVDAHPEFAQLPPAASPGVVELQFRAQRAGYLCSFPAATDHVIELTGARVGRCWTHQSDTELRLLDLVVLSSHRRQGIAGDVLTGLQARAAAAGLALRLAVWQENVAARSLYDRMGFVVADEANGYLSMVKACSGTARK